MQQFGEAHFCAHKITNLQSYKQPHKTKTTNNTYKNMKLNQRNLAPLVVIVAQAAATSLRGRSLAQGLLPKPQIKESVLPTLDKLSDHMLFPQFINMASLEDCESSLARKQQWRSNWVRQIDYEDLEVAQLLFDHYKVHLLPFYHKFFFDQNEDGEYFGRNGEYTQEVLLRYEQLETFWELTDSEGGAVDISTNHTVLMGGHGSVLSDRNALRRLFNEFFILTSSEIEDHIDFFQSKIESIFPRGYDFPLFTANAIAFGSNHFFRRDSVVIGDGILDQLDYLGFGGVGSDYILAHEFGHQVQYELLTDAELETTTPNETREIELMADSLAGYFLGHALGGSFTAKEIDDVANAAFFVGDCQPTNVGHHGTPQQRKCATDWAANMASAEGSWRVSKLTDFVGAYHQVLPKILDVDNSVCPFN